MALRKLHIHPLMREVLFGNHEEKYRTDPVFPQLADEEKPLLKEKEKQAASKTKFLKPPF